MRNSASHESAPWAIPDWLMLFLGVLAASVLSAHNGAAADKSAATGAAVVKHDAPELIGAFYCRLDSGEPWEQFAKVGPHADVQVRFGNSANRLIFWRASSYLPLWQTASGQWYFDELVPRKGDGSGLRTDKICQKSRVAIIEDSPARTKVLWRYLPDFSNPTLESWVEETFTVYPDGVCIRAVRKGTPTLKDWLDPANTKVQEVMLAENGIISLAESWREPTVLKLSGPSSGDYEFSGIGKSSRSYTLACKRPGQPGPLTLALQPGDGKTIRNPVLVVKDWGDADVQIIVGGEKFTSYKVGYARNMDLKGGDLVVWMNLASERATEIVLTPVGGSAPIARAPVRDPYTSKVPLFPEGSSDPGPFGAYYTQLKYFRDWDEPWRVGDAADIVVQFDDQPSRLVFWRGPAYVPQWVNDANHWYNNEFYERRPRDGGLEGGCAEPMQDYECRYSHARIISANDARVVVHWRYAPADFKYRHPFVDETGWGDWVDEYYTVYPDAVCVRQATLYTSGWEKYYECHEAIPLINPGTTPEDVLEIEALALTDYNGNKKLYSWQGGHPKKLDNLPIMLVRLKGRAKPFAIPESNGAVIDSVSIPNETRFNHYDDWPAWPASRRGSKWQRDPANDYREFWKILPSHSALMHYEWDDYSQEHGLVKSRTKLLLNGMTDKDDVNALIPLAKSWEQPPALNLRSPGFTGGAYDKAQRAYQITRLAWWWGYKDNSPGKAAGVVKLEFTMAGSADSPVLNPCFVVKNWPREARALLSIDGQPIAPGPQFRQGIESCVDGQTSLVVWVKKESAEPIAVTITSDRRVDGQEEPRRK